jgi:hypothetical protein
VTFDEEEAMATLERMGAGGAPVELVFRCELVDGRSAGPVKRCIVGRVPLPPLHIMGT